MALATDIAGDLVAVGQAHAANLSQRRVRLLRGRGVHARADTALLRRGTERGHLGLFSLQAAWLPNQLTCSGHANSIYKDTTDEEAPGRPPRGGREVRHT